MKLKFWTILFLITTPLHVVGCGYGLRGGGTILPPDVAKIYVPFVENESTEGALTTLFTEALRDTLERYGAVTVVSSERDADAVLSARVIKVEKTTRSVTTNNDVALQLDAEMTASAELKKKNGKVLWKDGNISVSKIYGASANATVSSSADFAAGILSVNDLAQLSPREQQRSQEQRSFQDLASLAAQKVYDAAIAPEF